MSKVVVIGTGTMGVGIAAGFLAYGADIVLLGRDLAKAEASIAKMEACADSIDPSWRSNSGNLLAGTIADWANWENTDLVIETISENLRKHRFIHTS